MTERRPSITVHGVETEYSHLLIFPGDVSLEMVGGCHNQDAKVGYYVRPSVSGASRIGKNALTSAVLHTGNYISVTGMMSNGGRLYVDPSGLEYATPETTTAEETVQRSFDGDIIVMDALNYLRSNGILADFQLNRRIVDHNRASRGVHLNTTTKLTSNDMHKQAGIWIATLNVAKGALFGSGGLLLNQNGETEYHHSPRLSLTESIHPRTSGYTHRPLVRVPLHGDTGSLRRIETVTSDALNFAWPLRASLVATNAVIGLIEMGCTDSLPQLQSSAAVRSAQSTGRFGPEGIVFLEKDDERQTFKSLDVIRKIAEIVLTVDETEDYLDDESKQVIPEIIEVADAAARDTDLVVRDVESVARLAAIKNQMQKTKSTLGSERMCQFDYKWDKIGGGTAEQLRSKGKVGWRGFKQPLAAPSVARRRRKNPPTDTRAFVRGNVIRHTQGADNSTWDQIHNPSATKSPIRMNPLQCDFDGFMGAHVPVQHSEDDKYKHYEERFNGDN